ncbi:MAG: glycosyltransferase family 2 protein [Candidatus Heimdallarchaeota archaeon]
MISIVIPVFNEEENVIPLFTSIVDVMSESDREYELIFVDDGSRDNTLNYLKSLLESGDGQGILRIIELRRNFGQTPAMLAGLAQAKGQFVVTMDGDQQNDPNDIPKLIEALTDEFDVICGWRKNRKDNMLKKLPSKINNRINRRLNNLEIHDSGCTLRIYRREAIEDLQLFAEGHRYIPAILAQQGFLIGEIVTNHRPRTLSKTKYGFKRLFRGFIDLKTLNILNKWGNKPIHFFSLWASVFFLASFLSSIWVLLERVAFHRFWSYYPLPVNINSNPLFFISFGVAIIGLLLLFMGFITELLLRKSYDSHKSYKILKEWS